MSRKLLDKISAIIAQEAYEANWVAPLLDGLSAFILSASRYLLSPFAGAAGIAEMRAKFYAFRCFRNPDAWTERTHCQLHDWPQCVKASQAHDSYTSIWLLEGCATRLIDSHIRKNRDLPWLADSAAQKEMVAASLLALHTGAGMSLAKFALSRCSAGATMPLLSAVIEEFLAVANERTLPNYRDCMVEPLGLVVRTLYPQWMSLISRLLSASSHEDCALFWHGSGRGLYFSPLQIVPSRRLRYWTLDEAVSDAPADHMRANLISGFFWAMTLVNIRHPEVLPYFLGGRSMEHWKPHATAISDGVSAALLVWHYLTGDTAVIEHFLGHLPSRAQMGLERFWEDQMVSFSRRRFVQANQRLHRDDRIGDIFQFQKP